MKCNIYFICFSTLLLFGCRINTLQNQVNSNSQKTDDILKEREMCINEAKKKVFGEYEKRPPKRITTSEEAIAAHNEEVVLRDRYINEMLKCNKTPMKEHKKIIKSE